MDGAQDGSSTITIQGPWTKVSHNGDPMVPKRPPSAGRNIPKRPPSGKFGKKKQSLPDVAGNITTSSRELSEATIAEEDPETIATSVSKDSKTITIPSRPPSKDGRTVMLPKSKPPRLRAQGKELAMNSLQSQFQASHRHMTHRESKLMRANCMVAGCNEKSLMSKPMCKFHGKHLDEDKAKNKRVGMQFKVLSWIEPCLQDLLDGLEAVPTNFYTDRLQFMAEEILAQLDPNKGDAQPKQSERRDSDAVQPADAPMDVEWTAKDVDAELSNFLDSIETQCLHMFEESAADDADLWKPSGDERDSHQALRGVEQLLAYSETGEQPEMLGRLILSRFQRKIVSSVLIEEQQTLVEEEELVVDSFFCFDVEDDKNAGDEDNAKEEDKEVSDKEKDTSKELKDRKEGVKMKTEDRPLVDVKVLYNTKREDKVPPGYHMIKRTHDDRGANLNKGAPGSKYIYLCIKRQSLFDDPKPDPLTAITVFMPESGEQLPYGFQVIAHTVDGGVCNINASTHGPSIFLCVARGAGADILDLQVMFRDRPTVVRDGFYEVAFSATGDAANLNLDNGGFPAHLLYRLNVSTALKPYHVALTQGLEFNVEGNHDAREAVRLTREGFCKTLATLTAGLYCRHDFVVITALNCFKQLPVSHMYADLANVFILALCNGAATLMAYLASETMRHALRVLQYAMFHYLDKMQVTTVVRVVETCMLLHHLDTDGVISSIVSDLAALLIVESAPPAPEVTLSAHAISSAILRQVIARIVMVAEAGPTIAKLANPNFTTTGPVFAGAVSHVVASLNVNLTKQWLAETAPLTTADDQPLPPAVDETPRQSCKSPPPDYQEEIARKAEEEKDKTAKKRRQQAAVTFLVSHSRSFMGSQSMVVKLNFQQNNISFHRIEKRKEKVHTYPRSALVKCAKNGKKDLMIEFGMPKNYKRMLKFKSNTRRDHFFDLVTGPDFEVVKVKQSPKTTKTTFAAMSMPGLSQPVEANIPNLDHLNGSVKRLATLRPDEVLTKFNAVLVVLARIIWTPDKSSNLPLSPFDSASVTVPTERWRLKAYGLRLVGRVLGLIGGGPKNSVVFQSSQFVQILRTFVVPAVVECVISPQDELFEQVLPVASTLWMHFGDVLVAERAAFIGLLSDLLVSPFCSANRKLAILRVLLLVSVLEASPVQLFYNFDSQAERSDVVQELMHALSKLCLSQDVDEGPHGAREGRPAQLRSASLKVLVTLTNNLHNDVAALRRPPTGRRGSVLERHEARKMKDKITLAAVQLATQKELKHAIEYLKERHAAPGQFSSTELFRSDASFSRTLARFLKDNCERLDKAEIGDLLSGIDNKRLTNPQYKELRRVYVDFMDFTGMDFDQAIRVYLIKGGFRLPGEAQKIDRLLDQFCKRYCSQNPGVFASQGSAFVVAFAMIMLNTDLHDNRLKAGKSASRKKMTLAQFLSNLRGTNEGADFPPEFLTTMYRNIEAEAIEWKEAQNSDHDANAEQEEVKQADDEEHVDEAALSRRKARAVWQKKERLFKEGQKVMGSMVRKAWSSIRQQGAHQTKWMRPRSQQSYEAATVLWEVCSAPLLDSLELGLRSMDSELVGVCISGCSDGRRICERLRLSPDIQNALTSMERQLKFRFSLLKLKRAIHATVGHHALIRDRRIRLKLYPQCAVVSELIDWLGVKCHVQQRPTGLELVNCLVPLGLRLLNSQGKDQKIVKDAATPCVFATVTQCRGLYKGDKTDFELDLDNGEEKQEEVPAENDKKESKPRKKESLKKSKDKKKESTQQTRDNTQQRRFEFPVELMDKLEAILDASPLDKLCLTTQVRTKGSDKKRR